MPSMKQTVTRLIDDIDRRSEATTTVKFSVDDRRYELDLTDEHASEFSEAMKPYIRAARVKSRPGRKPATSK
jgi:hypothetical protein